MAESPQQNGLVIHYGTSLAFDLSGLHSSATLLSRVRAALLVGLDRARSGRNLQKLLETLAAISVTEPVKFFASPQEWKPDAKTPAYPAVTTWTSSSRSQPDSVDEIRRTRRNVRILMQDLGDEYRGTVETTWHELLHPTVPFTHP